MKTSVLDFIDSKTLREQLKDYTIKLAIECVIISQSKKQTFEKKLEALKERYETCSPEEFEKGVYNCWCGPFYQALGMYISIIEKLLDEIKEDATYYVIDSDSYKKVSDDFTSYSEALAYCKEMNERLIVRYKDTGKPEPLVVENYMVVEADSSEPREWYNKYYKLNDDFNIISINYGEEWDWDIARSYADIPNKYKTGDIVEHDGKYYVIGYVYHHEKGEKCRNNYDDTAEGLYIYTFNMDDTDEFGFAGEYHSILEFECEIINPDDFIDETEDEIHGPFESSDEMFKYIKEHTDDYKETIKSISDAYKDKYKITDMVYNIQYLWRKRLEEKNCGLKWSE